MKKFISFAFIAAFAACSLQACAQGGPKDNAEQRLHRASLPSEVSRALMPDSTVITINYSQPALKGRVMGKDIEPMNGKVWRAGANEATWIQVTKDVTIEGKKLAAGKYGLYAIVNGNDWTFIINKTWDTWGAYSYKESDDVLRFTVKAANSCVFMERLVYTIDPHGKVSLLWGNTMASFTVAK